MGVCAVALGAGILIAAIFPVGALLFLVALLLIGPAMRGGEGMRIVVWKSPKMLGGILRKLFRVQA